MSAKKVNSRSKPMVSRRSSAAAPKVTRKPSSKLQRPAARKFISSDKPKAAALAKSSSKQSTVLKMLSGPNGTTIAAITKATNWQAHSVRGFLARVIKKKLKLNLTSEASAKGRIYWIKSGAASPASAASAK